MAVRREAAVAPRDVPEGVPGKVSVRRDRGRPRGATVVDRVLGATLSELARVGFDGLSVDEVAKLAEVNKTSVYRRWATREALVAAALERVAENASGTLPDTGTLSGDLFALMAPIMALVDSAEGRALLRAAMSERLTSTVAAMAADMIAARSAHPVSALEERARARGEWRGRVRAEALIAMLVGAVIHRAMLEHAPLSVEWLESLIDLSIYGALPRE